MELTRRSLASLLFASAPSVASADASSDRVLRTSSAIPITVFDGNVGQLNYDALPALKEAAKQAEAVDLCGLKLQISAPLPMAISMIGGDPNASEITSLPGFAGESLLDPFFAGKSSFGRVIEGVTLSTKENISLLKSSSNGGGGGRGRFRFERVKFVSMSSDAYMLDAYSHIAEAGAFTGSVFDSCSWFGALPLRLGVNQDDIILIAPRIHLKRAGLEKRTPIVLSGSNIALHSGYVALSNGYKSACCISVSQGNVLLQSCFFEGKHDFEAIIGCDSTRSSLTLNDMRTNTASSNSQGFDALVRVTTGPTDSLEKRLIIRNVQRKTGSLPGPSWLLLINSVGKSETGADIHLDVSSEWSEKIATAAPYSKVTEDFPFRVSGKVGLAEINGGYDVIEKYRKILPDFVSMQVFSVDQKVEITSTSFQLSLSSGGRKFLIWTGRDEATVGLSLYALSPAASVGLSLQLFNDVSSSSNIRINLGMNGSKSSDFVNIAPGEYIFVIYTGSDFRALI